MNSSLLAKYQIDVQYKKIVDSMEITGILSVIAGTKEFGVIGFDGEVYPVPTLDQVSEILMHNSMKLSYKMDEGFTRLLLTPMAISVLRLIDIVSLQISAKANGRGLFKIANNSRVPVKAKSKDSVWVWRKVREIFDTDLIIYFPKSYDLLTHKGFKKSEVVKNTNFCAVAGWSISLIKPNSGCLPDKVKDVANTIQRTEETLAPADYLKDIVSKEYPSETGWTIEDFLTYFIFSIEDSNLIVYDRQDNNCLWLTGNYIPHMGKFNNLVPAGYYESRVGKLCISAHRTANKLKVATSNTIVRFGL